MNEMRPLLLELYARYPKARLSDYIKLLYQSEFGCEHFAPEDTTGHTLLLRELEKARPGQHLMEKVGGGGNRSAAAAQFAGTDVNTAVKRIYAAIDDYLG